MSDDFIGPPQQDYIMLGGFQSPGRARVVDASSKRNWQKRGGYGLSGAYLIYTGVDLAEFSVFIDLWDETHWIAWDFFARMSLSKPLAALPFGVPIQALGIEHPLINGPPLNIHSVVVEEVTSFDQDDEGLWTCEIKLIEYRAPLPALGNPKGSIPAVGAKQPPAPTAAGSEIDRLRAQLAGLAKKFYGD